MDAHLTLGNWLLRRGSPTRPIAAYKRGARAQARRRRGARQPGAAATRGRGRTRTRRCAEVFRAALQRRPAQPADLVRARHPLPRPRARRGGAKQLPRGARRQPEDGSRAQRPRRDRVRVAATSRRPRRSRRGARARARLRTGRYNLARILEAQGDPAGAEALYARGARELPRQRQGALQPGPAAAGSAETAQGYLGELAASRREGARVRALLLLPGARGAGARAGLDGGRGPGDARARGPGALGAAPLGHFVLADVYSRRGEAGKAEDEAAKGRKLEAAQRKNPAPRL